MPDNWKDYKDWKELMENIRRSPQEDCPIDDSDDDDDVESLVEMLRDYSE